MSVPPGSTGVQAISAPHAATVTPRSVRSTSRVAIEEVVNTGGLAVKNATLMQIYADIIGRPLKVAASDQTCALGAALFGAAASGEIGLAEAQGNVCKIREHIYQPIPENQAVYEELYALYRTLHDAFGTAEWSGQLDQVMKDLIAIRQRQRQRQG